MIRFLGVMIGSAATLGGMLLLLGKPELRIDERVDADVTVQAADRDPVALNPVDAEDPVEHADPAAAEAAPEAAAPTETAATKWMPEVTRTTNLLGPPNPDEAPDLDAQIRPPLDTSQAGNDSVTMVDAEPNWHSFWNPFRSEIAANGFATRLTRVTGIDYRVLRLKPGSYQVAFAYADDNERRTKIAQIEQATGLELPEDSL